MLRSEPLHGQGVVRAPEILAEGVEEHLIIRCGMGEERHGRVEVEVVRVAEESLPVAWEIGEWDVVLWASAWLTIAYLKLGKTADAKKVLDRVFKVVPLRTFTANPTTHPLVVAPYAVWPLRLAIMVGAVLLWLVAGRQGGHDFPAFRAKGKDRAATSLAGWRPR